LRTTLAGGARDDRDAFRRVTRGWVTPTAEPSLPRLTESLPSSAHRSHPEAASPSVCQHAVGSASEPAPDTPIRLAARRASPDARCVGPTSAISLLRTSTRASSAPGFVLELALALPGVSSAITSERFASAGRTRVICPPRRALSSLRGVCGRASGTPVASLTSAPSLARRGRHESCQGRTPGAPA